MPREVQNKTTATAMVPGGRTAALADLKRRIAHLEGAGGAQHGAETTSSRPQQMVWRLGLEAVDARLPVHGLSPGGLHEIVPARQDDMAAASAFALALIQKRPQNARRPLLWCQSEQSAREFALLHGAGLAAFGLAHGDVVCVRTRRDADTLWVLEEAARSQVLAAVIGETGAISFKQTQRLSRAATDGTTPVFSLRPPGEASGGATATRWRVTTFAYENARAGEGAHPLAAGRDYAPKKIHWQVSLERCRGGRSGEWCLEWSYETHRFGLASRVFHRPLQASAAGDVSGPGAKFAG